MSSNTAKDFSVPKHSLYSGSKGAIDSFVRVFAKDCGHKKITVNAVAPGGTVTDMFHDVSQHYIPNGEKYSAEERQKAGTPYVSLISQYGPAVFFLSLTERLRWPRMRRLSSEMGTLWTLHAWYASWPVTRPNGSMARSSPWTEVLRKTVME